MQKIKKAWNVRFYEGDPGNAADLPILPIKKDMVQPQLGLYHNHPKTCSSGAATAAAPLLSLDYCSAPAGNFRS